MITILGLHISMAVLWLVLAAIFLIIEAITIGLTTVWFAAGAFIALILSLLNVSMGIQIVVFLIVSLCLLAFTRKVFVEKLKTGSENTNTEAILGEVGQALSDIEGLHVGQVKVGSQVWSALSKDGKPIAKDELVKVISIEGVKLIVVPLTNE